MNSSFLSPKISRKFDWSHPQRGRQIQAGQSVKWAIFDRCLAMSQRQCKIGPYLVWNDNKNSYALCRMLLFPVTLSDPYVLQTTPISTFPVAFHISVTGRHKDFKFVRRVEHSKSKPTYDKLSLKGTWSGSHDPFKFWKPK